MILKAQNIKKEYKRLTKSTGYITAVNTLSLELKENTFCVITGRSGSGKSTLLNMLSGILTPTEGKISIENKNNGAIDLYSLNDRELSVFRNKTFGIIPQGQCALSSLSVLENVKLPALVYSNDSKEITDYAEFLLEKVGIFSLKNEKPDTLSGGELRRLSIARALINRPSFIFADEPTNDLDDENSCTVLELLKLISGENTSVTVVSHDADVQQFADQIYRMDAGNIQKIK